MDLTLALLCVAAGFAAGVVNTLAGSGSLFTLPVLLFMGLPAHIANGTNRVGILMQTAVGAFTLHRKSGLKWSGDLWMIFPAIAGSFTGAMIAVEMDEGVLKIAIGIVMLALLALTLLNFEGLLRQKSDSDHKSPAPLVFVLLFMIGLYGGFIQAGVGLLLLSLMLLLMRFSMVHANLLKNLINFCLTIPAFLVFAWHGHIRWEIGLIIAAGQMAGAWVAATYASGNKGSLKYIRLLLVIMMGWSAWELLEIRKWVF
jgi:uncharacterized protein